MRNYEIRCSKLVVRAHVDEGSCCRVFTETCEHFSDKSEWFHFPSKDCETAYYAVGYGNDAQIIEEPIWGWDVQNGKSCVLDRYGCLYEIDVEAFLTQEDAEKDVKRRKSKWLKLLKRVKKNLLQDAPLADVSFRISWGILN